MRTGRLFKLRPHKVPDDRMRQRMIQACIRDSVQRVLHTRGGLQMHGACHT